MFLPRASVLFSRWGEPAALAAVSAGAHHFASTGERSFIRHVFDHYGPLVERSGSTIVGVSEAGIGQS